MMEFLCSLGLMVSVAVGCWVYGVILEYRQRRAAKIKALSDLNAGRQEQVDRLKLELEAVKARLDAMANLVLRGTADTEELAGQLAELQASVAMLEESREGGMAFSPGRLSGRN